MTGLPRIQPLLRSAAVLPALAAYAAAMILLQGVADLPPRLASLFAYLAGFLVALVVLRRAAEEDRGLLLLGSLGLAIAAAMPVVVGRLGISMQATTLANALLLLTIVAARPDRIGRPDAAMAMKGEAEPLRPLVYATLVAGTAALATAIAVSDFTYDQSLNGILGGLFILIVGGVLLRRFRLERLGSCMEGMALLFAISALASLSSFLLAATALPYADAGLAAFDARFFFGFSWRGLIELIKHQDRLLYGFSWVYTTLNWQPALVVALLFCLRRSEDAWTFIAGWTLTLMATMALFPFLPAVAGYLHYGIPRTDVPSVAVAVAWSHIDILDAVRDGSLRAVTPSSLAGIVTFPSFHAAASVLLAWGFMRIRFLGAAGIALNVAMLLSSIVIGGHYLVDVVAGAAIAAAALLLAVRMRAWAARRSPSTLAVAGAEPA